MSYYSDNIKPIMKDWKTEAKVTGKILYRLASGKNEYDDADMKLVVCTNFPGKMIGQHGKLVDKYKTLINEKMRGHKVFISIVETDQII